MAEPMELMHPLLTMPAPTGDRFLSFTLSEACLLMLLRQPSAIVLTTREHSPALCDRGATTPATRQSSALRVAVLWGWGRAAHRTKFTPVSARAKCNPMGDRRRDQWNRNFIAALRPRLTMQIPTRAWWCLRMGRGHRFPRISSLLAPCTSRKYRATHPFTIYAMDSTV